jgi:hypothetical protein
VSGKVCDGNPGNILEAQPDFPDIQHCQGLCQAKFVMGMRTTFTKLRLMFKIYNTDKGCVRKVLMGIWLKFLKLRLMFQILITLKGCVK